MAKVVFRHRNWGSACKSQTLAKHHFHCAKISSEHRNQHTSDKDQSEFSCELASFGRILVAAVLSLRGQRVGRDWWLDKIAEPMSAWSMLLNFLIMLPAALKAPTRLPHSGPPCPCLSFVKLVGVKNGRLLWQELSQGWRISAWFPMMVWKWLFQQMTRMLAACPQQLFLSEFASMQTQSSWCMVSLCILTSVNWLHWSKGCC